MARALLGGLLTYALTDLLFADGQGQPPLFEHADNVIEVVMRALAPL